jgi:hypothetical protein
VLDEPEDPLVAGVGGAPLPSVRVWSTLMWGSTVIASCRLPALMTSDCTLAVAHVRLTPSTVAMMEFPLLARAMSMVLACPAVPVQVRTPSARVGATVSKSLDSSDSKLTNAARGRARFRSERCLPLIFR